MYEVVPLGVLERLPIGELHLSFQHAVVEPALVLDLFLLNIEHPLLIMVLTILQVPLVLVTICIVDFAIDHEPVKLPLFGGERRVADTLALSQPLVVVALVDLVCLDLPAVEVLEPIPELPHVLGGVALHDPITMGLIRPLADVPDPVSIDLLLQFEVGILVLGGYGSVAVLWQPQGVVEIESELLPLLAQECAAGLESGDVQGQQLGLLEGVDRAVQKLLVQSLARVQVGVEAVVARIDSQGVCIEHCGLDEADGQSGGAGFGCLVELAHHGQVQDLTGAELFLGDVVELFGARFTHRHQLVTINFNINNIYDTTVNSGTFAIVPQNMQEQHQHELKHEPQPQPEPEQEHRPQPEQANLELTPATLRGHCYCSGIHFTLRTEPPPFKSLYCHCQSCRRAHAAPLYHICYVPEQCFVIAQGQEHVKEYSRGEGAPVRAFCGQCGTRVYNRLPLQPELGVGVFPCLLESPSQRALPAVLRAGYHYLSHETVLPLADLDDGLLRK